MISLNYPPPFSARGKGAWVPSEFGVVCRVGSAGGPGGSSWVGRAGHVPCEGVGDQGANPGLKVPALVAGMVAGADSINDMDLLRRGGMGRLFSGVRAPSTLGIFLRAFTVGHVRQLDAVDSRFLPRPAGQAPILAGAERMVWLDVDDTVARPMATPSKPLAAATPESKG